MLYGVWLGSTSSCASTIICTAYNSLLLLEDHRDLLSGHPAIVVQFPPYPSTAATTVLGANPGEWTIIFLALPRAETKFTSRDTLEQVEGKFSGPVKREGNVQSMMGQPSLPGARGDDDAATSTVLSTLP